jgi:2-polyprenyl-3-methyl-5-hydroxy-6-metoxy-1,4-benzoquinol methylase
MKHTYYIRQSALFRWYRNRAYGFDKYFIGKNVLEVGPNKGVLFEKYYPVSRKYTLLEPNRHFERDYLKLQRRHGNLHYEINGFESYAGDGPFDTIVMMAVIAHIRMDPERAAPGPGSHRESPRRAACRPAPRACRSSRTRCRGTARWSRRGRR